MHQPSERFAWINQELVKPQNMEYLANLQNTSHNAWLLARSYQIYTHRFDRVSENACIAAFDQHANPQGMNSPGLRQWMESESQRFQQRDHSPIPPNTSPFPWTAYDYSVTSRGNKTDVSSVTSQPIAAIIRPDPESSYFPEEQRTAQADAILIANASLFARKLDDAQIVLLGQMHSLAEDRRVDPKLLSLYKDNYDSFLDSYDPQLQCATPGDWVFDPKTFTLSTQFGKQLIPIATLGDTAQTYSPEQLRSIEANAQLIQTIPALSHQLHMTCDNLGAAATALDQANSHKAFLQLRDAAIANDPVLRAARGQELNPHALEPVAGTPQFEKFVRSNLHIIDKALPKIPRRSEIQGATYQVAEQQSGIYSGTIAAQTADSYLQHRTDDAVIAHWKGSFDQRLEIGKQYNISYNQGKASAKELENKKVQEPDRNR